MNPRIIASMWDRMRMTLFHFAFFAAYFLFVWLCVDPQLHYEARRPVFFVDARFLLEFASVPGGPLECLSALLTHLYAVSCAGAAFSAVLAWSICALIKGIIKTLSGFDVRCFHLAAGVILLGIQLVYDAPFAQLCLGTMFALLMVLIHARLIKLPTILRVAFFLFAVLALNYTAAGFWIVYAVLAALADLSVGRRKITRASGLLLAASAAVLLFAKAFPYTGFYDSVFGLLMCKPFGLVLGLYIFIAALFSGTIWLRRHDIRIQLHSSHEQPDKLAGHLLSLLRGEKRLGLSFLLLLVFAGAVAIAEYDSEKRRMIAIHRYARHNMWSNVIEEGRKLKRMSISNAIDINRALFHAGKLPYEQFSFPQPAWPDLLLSIQDAVKGSQFLGNPGLFTGYAPGIKWCLPMIDTLIELGQINYAEHWAFETLEADGNQADLLKKLATVYFVKGKIEAGRTFLGLLRKNPIHKRYVEPILLALYNDPLLENNSRIAQLRSVMAATDKPSHYLETEDLLKQLLHTNKRNRMAFEYLMAHYLLTCQIEKGVQLLSQLGNYNYLGLPRHYQELLLLDQKLKGNGDTGQLGKYISAETILRFQAFDEVLTRHGGNIESARIELENKHYDTYWFYYLFNRGMAQKPEKEIESYQ